MIIRKIIMIFFSINNDINNTENIKKNISKLFSNFSYDDFDKHSSTKDKNPIRIIKKLCIFECGIKILLKYE